MLGRFLDDPLTPASRADIDRFARAIVAGDATTPRPGRLARRAILIACDATGSNGYRAGPRAPTTLRIHARRATRRAVVLWAGALLTAAAIASTWWYRGGAAPGFWLLAPTLVIGGYLIWRTLVLLDRFTISVADGVLRCDPSMLPWRRAVALPVSSIAQLHVIEKDFWFRLEARLTDGTRTSILRYIAWPDLALYLERQLELAMGIVDAPVAPGDGLLSRDVPLPNGPSRGPFWAQAGVLAAIAAGVVIGFRWVGAPLATVEIHDDGSETTFSVDGPRHVTFSTEFRVVKPFEDAPAPDVTYELAIVRDGRALATMTCHGSEQVTWSETETDEHQYFEMPLEGCAADLPAAGQYTLRARRTSRPGAPPIAMDASVTVRAR